MSLRSSFNEPRFNPGMKKFVYTDKNEHDDGLKLKFANKKDIVKYVFQLAKSGSSEAKEILGKGGIFAALRLYSAIKNGKAEEKIGKIENLLRKMPLNVFTVTGSLQNELKFDKSKFKKEVKRLEANAQNALTDFRLKNETDGWQGPVQDLQEANGGSLPEDVQNLQSEVRKLASEVKDFDTRVAFLLKNNELISAVNAHLRRLHKQPSIVAPQPPAEKPKPPDTGEPTAADKAPSEEGKIEKTPGTVSTEEKKVDTEATDPSSVSADITPEQPPVEAEKGKVTAEENLVATMREKFSKGNVSNVEPKRKSVSQAELDALKNSSSGAPSIRDRANTLFSTPNNGSKTPS